MTLTRLIRHGWPLALLFATAPLAHAEPLRIGAEDDWYPYTALRDGQVQGMSVDIVKAAFAATSTDIELLPYPYARCMQLALKGELVACFNTAPNAQIAVDYLLPKTALFHDDILLWARICLCHEGSFDLCCFLWCDRCSHFKFFAPLLSGSGFCLLSAFFHVACFSALQPFYL